MIELERAGLTDVTGQDVIFRDDTVHLTTTDQPLKHYQLETKNLNSFLRCYSQLVSENIFHLNVILNSLSYHTLVVDVDYGTDSVEISPHILYKNFVDEVMAHMCLLYDELAENRPRRNHMYDCFLMNRRGTKNFHLIFPFLHMERCDYVWLIERIKLAGPFPQIDNVQGWQMYRSVKKKSVKFPYTATSVLKINGVSNVDNYLRVMYPGKNPAAVMTRLLYPCWTDYKKDHFGIMKFPKILIDARYIDPDITFDLNNYKLLTTLSTGDHSPQLRLFVILTEGLQSCLRNNAITHVTKSLHVFLKTYQNEYDFVNSCTEVNTTLYKFFPVKRERELSLVPRAATHDDRDEGDGPDPFTRKLVDGFNQNFSYDQIESVINDLKENFQSVWESIVFKNDENYTELTILYNLCFQYGVRIPQFDLLYVPKKSLDVISNIFMNDEIEWLGKFLVDEILVSLPVVIQSERHIRIFDWSKRKWTNESPLSSFLQTLVASLIDHTIGEETDEEIKKCLRKRRRKFISESRTVEPLVVMKCLNRNLHFDMKPWIIALDTGITYDVLSGQFRLTLPEDYALKRTFLPAEYHHPLPQIYEPFLDIEKYFYYFNQLKTYLKEPGKKIDTFKVSDDEKVNALFVFLATVFCEEYDMLRYFLYLVSDCLIGRNYRRWFCVFIGHTSNSKSTIFKLLLFALGEYAATMNPDLLYQSKFTHSESASPEFSSKQGIRAMVIEEVSSLVPINIQNLCSLTGEQKRYTRGLYQDGREFNITFKIMFTCNDWPSMELTPAVLERLHVVKFKSIFSRRVNTYDFTTRIFPQIPNLNTLAFSDCFLVLLIYTLHSERQAYFRRELITDTSKMFPITAPEDSLAIIETHVQLENPFSLWERNFLIESPNQTVSAEDVKSHLKTFLMKYRKLCRGFDDCSSLYTTFCQKYQDRICENMGITYFENLSLTHFSVQSKLK